jgi:hypothetical protein
LHESAANHAEETALNTKATAIKAKLRPQMQKVTPQRPTKAVKAGEDRLFEGNQPQITTNASDSPQNTHKYRSSVRRLFASHLLLTSQQARY